tara:strand:- start:298 stop:768 length:471 start_codon:yes stop_codon:yes gene_type:complete
MERWFSGAGQLVDYDAIMADIKLHSELQGSVYIGTDSHLIKSECVFSTAICLHGAHDQTGGRYYFKKTRFQKSKFPTLLERITSEVQSSIHIAMNVLEVCPTVDIELHLDVSPASGKEATSRFSDMLVGYARGVGFPCKVKPDAFAATTVADKHTK